MASRVRAVVKPKPVAASAPLRIATYSSTTWAATSSGTGEAVAHVRDVGAHEVWLERLELELGVGAEAVDVGHVLRQATVVLVRRL
eukprot:scaffold102768_cov17-Phaeocystis_antarctica.AAC.1